MLLRVALLVLCVFLLVLAIRFCEWISWFEAERLPLQLVDPLALSIKELQRLLEARGIPHDELLEKSELVEAVESSGGLSVEESEVLVQSGADFQESLNFTSERHFLEEVEDSKSTVWAVRVVPHGHKPFPNYPLWNVVANRLSRIGIQSGTFYCPRHNTWCLRQGWKVMPALILAMPAKDDRGNNIEVYQGPAKEEKIVSWYYSKLAESVSKIREERGLEEWESDRHPVKVLHHTEPGCRIAHLIPAFFSALAVQFVGKVSFAVMDKSKPCKDRQLRTQKDKPKSVILVKTPEFTHVYGSRKGEHFSNQALKLFLTTLTPTSNDLFILALMFINYSCVFEIFLSRGSMARRIVRTLWFMAKGNFVLCSVWLPLVSLCQVSQLRPLIGLFMSYYRGVMNSGFVSVLRHDALVLMRFPVLVLLAVAASIVILSHLDRRWKLGLITHHSDMQLPFLDFMPTVDHLVHFDPITAWPLYTTRMSEIPDEKWLQKCVTDLMSTLPSWECGEAGGALGECCAEPHAPECAICLDVFRKGVGVCSLPCSHAFHCSCAEMWMTSDCENRWKCPMCRQSIL